MFDCRLLVNDINIDKGKISFNLAFVCPYNINVVAPKVKAVFRSENETRRLPVPVSNYLRRRETDSAVIICSYTFLLNYILKNTNDSSDISVEFELEYGDEFVSPVRYWITAPLLEKSISESVPGEFFADEWFDGVTAYANSEAPTQAMDDDLDIVYKFALEPENSRIIIKQFVTEKKSEGPVKYLRFLVMFIALIFNFCLCFLLLPYFVIDGILAGLNLLPRHRYKKVEGVVPNILGQIKTNISTFLKGFLKNDKYAMYLIKPVVTLLRVYYNHLVKKPVVENRVTFLSGRRDEMGGNEKFVYDLIKDRKDIDFRFLMFSDVNGSTKASNIKEFVKLYATSKVVIVDDYFSLLNMFKKRDEVTLFQLWHACGAFKTFGFTRLGKPGGPKQTDPAHRMYDYTIVSSEEIVKCYAEGFGISDSSVLPTGIPRTDIFFDDAYAVEVKENFYKRYPQLKDKKIVLFAPTFRGKGQISGYYPLNVFNPSEFRKSVGDDYAVIVKLHPFCKKRYEIDEADRDYIIDLSDDDELNDLLFVTDLLITDYSSVVFEASLLNIPMLFYAYDLYEYVADRDFYVDYENFVPGRIVFTEKELAEAVKSGDYKSELVLPFRDRYFSYTDGKSSERVAQAILDALK